MLLQVRFSMCQSKVHVVPNICLRMFTSIVCTDFFNSFLPYNNVDHPNVCIIYTVPTRKHYSFFIAVMIRIMISTVLQLDVTVVETM